MRWFRKLTTVVYKRTRAVRGIHMSICLRVALWPFWWRGLSGPASGKERPSYKRGLYLETPWPQALRPRLAHFPPFLGASELYVVEVGFARPERQGRERCADVCLPRRRLGRSGELGCGVVLHRPNGAGVEWVCDVDGKSISDSCWVHFRSRDSRPGLW